MRGLSVFILLAGLAFANSARAGGSVRYGVHAGPAVLAHHDPEAFDGDDITVGRGAGAGFSLRLEISESFAVEPLLELAWLDGQSYYGYKGSALYAVLGSRFAYAAHPSLDLYALLHLGGVVGGNADGTPVFGVSWRVGLGARFLIWRAIGVFVEPRMSAFSSADGSPPAVGIEVIGGPALLF